jgi:hypothetical protein
MTLPDPSVSRQTANTTNEEHVMNDFRLLIKGKLVGDAAPATGGAAGQAGRRARSRAGHIRPSPDPAK